jgi:hypothetical protein
MAGDVRSTRAALTRALHHISRAAQRQRLFLGVACMALVRRHAHRHVPLTAAAAEMADDTRRFWLTWLPALIAVCPGPPLAFVQAVIKPSPWHFALHIELM